MSFAALAVVVLASLFHATWNLLAKRAADAGAAFVFAYTLVSGVAYAPWALWLAAHHAVAWRPVVLGCIVLSGFVHLGYGVCLQRGYQVADLSVVYPVARGTGPLLSSIAAFVLLGETPTVAGVAGLVAVVVGIVLISTQGDLSAFRPGGQSGVRWGTVTGGLIAGYTVVDAYAVKDLGVSPVVVSWGAFLVEAVALVPYVARTWPATRTRMHGRWRVAAAVGLLSPVAYILVLTALRLGAPVNAVAPAREMSMMVGALLGMVVLHEAVGRWRLVGCAVMIVGVVLLGGS